MDTFKPAFKKVLTITIPGKPQAVQSAKFKRIGKFVRTYQPDKVVNWKTFVRLTASEAVSGIADWVPLNGALAVRFTYVFPPLKSMPKRIQRFIADGGTVLKITKPDLTDNLNKGVCDGLSGVVWSDDSRVAMIGNSIKKYGAVPQTVVQIYQIEGVDAY